MPTLLLVFDRAVRIGDSGLIYAAMSFFTVWLQGTGSTNYKCGLLRLAAPAAGGVVGEIAQFLDGNLPR